MKLSIFYIAFLVQLNYCVSLKSHLKAQTLSESNVSAESQKMNNQNKVMIQKSQLQKNQNKKVNKVGPNLHNLELQKLKKLQTDKMRLSTVPQTPGKIKDIEVYNIKDDMLFNVTIIDKSLDFQSNPDQNDKKVKTQDLDANKTRFSNGDAAYFFDVLSPIVEKLYIKEAAASFQAFAAKNPLQVVEDKEVAHTSENKDKGINSSNVNTLHIKESPYVEQSALATGLKEFEWDVDDATASSIFHTYVKPSTRTKLYLREFLYMENSQLSQHIFKDDCTNCLQETREVIRNIFQRADCDKSGEITAEQLYDFLSHFKKNDKTISITPSMVNDFFLSLMNPETATINIQEFGYGIMCGYMERNYPPDGQPNLVEAKKFMDLRKLKVKLGNGPK